MSTQQPPIAKYLLEDLEAAYPDRAPFVIDGLVRQGEIANVISYSKVGKSWLMYPLLLSIATGRRWLDAYQCAAGRVLIVDSELQKQELAYRLPLVAGKMNITKDEYRGRIEVWPLRGNLRTFGQLVSEFDGYDSGHFTAIVFDARYKFEDGNDENSNSQTTLTYNLLDRIAEKTGAAVLVVHHCSKGDQSDKRVIDVGAGAGAQARAADCHIVLREHKRSGCVTMEAAVRSFASPSPVVLHYEFPLWHLDGAADPRTLQSPRESRQSSKDAANTAAVITAVRAAGGSLAQREIEAATGLGRDVLRRLLPMLVSQRVLIEHSGQDGRSRSKSFGVA